MDVPNAMAASYPLPNITRSDKPCQFSGHGKTRIFNPADTRQQMAQAHPDLACFASEVRMPAIEHREADMQIVEL